MTEQSSINSHFNTKVVFSDRTKISRRPTHAHSTSLRNSLPRKTQEHRVAVTAAPLPQVTATLFTRLPSTEPWTRAPALKRRCCPSLPLRPPARTLPLRGKGGGGGGVGQLGRVNGGGRRGKLDVGVVEGSPAVVCSLIILTASHGMESSRSKCNGFCLPPRSSI